MKKNITITIDEELIKVAERYEAETAKSVSHFFEHAGYLMLARYSVASGGGLSFEKVLEQAVFLFTILKREKKLCSLMQ